MVAEELAGMLLRVAWDAWEVGAEGLGWHAVEALLQLEKTIIKMARPKAKRIMGRSLGQDRVLSNTPVDGLTSPKRS